jgi:regulatory protein YycI of two-component signal transduction system YycFG
MTGMFMLNGDEDEIWQMNLDNKKMDYFEHLVSHTIMHEVSTNFVLFSGLRY